jgi:hypothetical protein
MLIVAYQAAFGVRGQGRFPGPGKAEEQSRVVVLADVGRAVHGHHAVTQGQQVVQQCEDRFLDLAAIAGVADDAQLLGKVQHDEGFSGCLVDLRKGLEAGH